MKKTIIAVFTLVFLLATLLLPVHASQPHLIDDAELLSESEAAQIEKKLDKLCDKYDMDIVVLTVDSLDDEPPQDYADDYYDENEYGKDGILLLISTEYNDWHISTSGYGITVITDAGLEYMSQQFLPYLSEENYSEALLCFAETCEDFIEQAESGDPYDTHNLPKEPFDIIVNLIIALVIGLIVALIATGVMKGKLKSVRMQPEADTYISSGSLKITNSRDLFLYNRIERREKPKQSSGSSTHTSSSGNTHGGGGGKF